MGEIRDTRPYHLMSPSLLIFLSLPKLQLPPPISEQISQRGAQVDLGLPAGGGLQALIVADADRHITGPQTGWVDHNGDGRSGEIE